MVASRFGRTSLIELLRSPHLSFGAGAEEPSPRAIGNLDHALREAGYLGDPRRLEALAAGWSGDLALAARAACGACSALAPLATVAPVSAHIGTLTAFLDRYERPYSGAGEPGGRHLGSRAAVRASLHELRTAAQRHDDPPARLDAVAASIRRWLESQTFTPRRGTGGVQLVDARAARYGDFDAVHLAGLVDGEWPEPTGRNIFYPPFLLSQLGWPPDSARAEAARAEFDDLLRLARLETSVSTFALENDAIVEPSPLLEDIEHAHLEVVRVPAATLEVFTDEALATKPAAAEALTGEAAAWLDVRLARPPADTPAYRGHVGASGPATRAYAVSAIDRYLDCPFKYFAATVLRLPEEVPDPAAMSPKARGMFEHEVFRAFFAAWETTEGGAIGPERLDAARALFSAVAVEQLARLPEGEAALERMRLLGSPASAGLGEIVLAAEAVRPVAVRERLLEHSIEGEFDLQGPDGLRRVRLRGKADRVDLLEDRTLRVIDYKSGRAPDDSRSIQLPIYAVCLQQQLQASRGEDWRVAEASYMAFGERDAVRVVVGDGPEGAAALREARRGCSGRSKGSNAASSQCSRRARGCVRRAGTPGCAGGTMPRSDRTAPRLPFDDPVEEPPADPVVARDEAARAASVDPSRNVVLEASAGTGKTRVLVTRYINLLRAGVDPSNVLAITFTRKAAAEMRERIVLQLRELGTRSAADEARWRELRARLGDIEISTIDAFCLSLLREFPLEADLDPGFDIADETETPRLMDEALDSALRAARRLSTSDADVELVLARLGERKLKAGLAALLDRRLVAGSALRRFLGSGPGPDGQGAFDAAVARLAGLLAAGDGGVEAFLADGPRAHPAFPLFAADLRAVAGGTAASRAVLDRLATYFITNSGTPRSRPAPLFRKDHCPSPAGWTRHSRAVASLAPYVAEALASFERDVNRAMARGVLRLFHVARARYRRALVSRAAVDFTEGLWRALGLLRRMDEFAQSRYRLEARYHHVLVDEFQDTSRAQWRLVARLIESWGEGAGLSHDAPLQPSIFIVGDRKQSIYGFRDADVRLLGRARRHIQALRPGARVRRSISRSFRSAPDLLAFTNDLFGAIEVADRRPDAFRYRDSDRFPVAAGLGNTGEESLGIVPAGNAAESAAVIAREVERLLSDALVRDRQTGLPRPAQPGDFAILFRSRESHREFESALESKGIPTYVYKGLGFFDADEVKDLVALVRYLADPSSDLRAAALLRSRLARLSDVGVRRLAPRLAEALMTDEEGVAGVLDGEDRRALVRLRASLRRWLPLVDRIPPAELLDVVLRDSAYAVRAARTARRPGEGEPQEGPRPDPPAAEPRIRHDRPGGGPSHAPFGG